MTGVNPFCILAALRANITLEMMMARKDQSGTTSGRHCRLEHMPMFNLLSEETRQHLRSICTVHHLLPNDTLLYQGDEVRRVYFVTTGLLRLQKQLVDGRIQIVGLLPREHMVGTVFVEKHAFAVEAVVPSEVISFEARQFRSAISTSPELEQVVFRSFQDEVDASLNWLILLSHTKVRQRLAGLLIILLSKYQNPPKLADSRPKTLSIKIPLSRIDLSNLLGVRPESLSRAFHALADDGLIEIVKHDHVRIVDVDGLAIEVGDPELFGSETDDHAGRKASK